LERVSPLRGSHHSLPPRLLTNLCLSGLAFLVGAGIVKPVGLSLAAWTSQRPFGLLHIVALPAPLQFGIGFLLLDLSFYYWHRLNHTVPWLWRFHNVHHTDPELDVSTSFRFHFGEIILSTGFRSLQVGLIGVSPMTYLLYEFCFQSETMFHHSNWGLPVQLERSLNKFLVTPRMHGIHHSIVKEENNSNYSVVFSWWDQLHRTWQVNIPQSAITIGVPAYQQSEDNLLGSVLAMPFRKQRDYWLKPDGTRPRRDSLVLE
jgi:sterol desaturase/sphingolipid hydroxylase (fatty acid hydroxylase superfamily)